MKTLVVVAHPDDECLSCGGLLQNRLRTPDSTVTLLVVFGRRYNCDNVSEHLAKQEAQTRALKLSVETLESHAQSKLVYFYPEKEEGEPYKHGYYKLLNYVEGVLGVPGTYDEVVIPSLTDRNQDHRHLADVCRIALRPSNLGQVKRVLQWHAHDGGTPAGANWFEPMTVNDIQIKQQAIDHYQDEKRIFPHPRSLDNIVAHAQMCGSIAGIPYAEPFTLLLSRGV